MAGRWRGWRSLLLCSPRRAVRVVATALAFTSACFALSCLLLLSSAFRSYSYPSPPTSYYEYHFSWNLLSPLLNLSSFFAHAHWSEEPAELELQPPRAMLPVPNVPMTKQAAAAASQSPSRGNPKNHSSISRSHSDNKAKFAVPVQVDPNREAPNEKKLRDALRENEFLRSSPFIATTAPTTTRARTPTLKATTTTTTVTTTATTTTTKSSHNTSRHALPEDPNRLSLSQRTVRALIEWLQWRAKYLLTQASRLNTDPLNVRGYYFVD